MVKVKPFRALRYDSEKTKGLTAVLAPPYDVITAEQQEALYEASPYNMVRLELGKEFDSDNDQDNRYTRATADFQKWIDSGIFKQEEQDAVYVIRQKFSYNGVEQARIAVTAVMEFPEDGSLTDSVYPHENTLSGPKADRTKLLQAIPANLSPIFCVYPDKGATVQKRLEKVVQGVPSETADLGDQTVEMWVVTDKEFIEVFQSQLSDTGVLIADGHHRFSVAHANRAQYGGVMASFVSMEDSGLVVWPIHRVIDLEGQVNWDDVKQFCDLQEVPDLDVALQWLKSQQGIGHLAVSDGKKVYQAVLKESIWSSLTKESELTELDVSLLRDVILPGIEATQTTYIADPHRALRIVQSGEAKLVWYIRSVALQHVFDLAKKGLVMAPKTTYFYPKMISGIAINAFK